MEEHTVHQEHGIASEQQLNAIDNILKKREAEGLKNWRNHFDRIHDKLFNFNNILIISYFALSMIEKSVALSIILTPIANLAFLIWIEFRMMEKGRFESSISRQPLQEIIRHESDAESATLYSLHAITSTIIVTILFLYYLLK